MTLNIQHGNGAAIVVRERESRLHGEGRQDIIQFKERKGARGIMRNPQKVLESLRSKACNPTYRYQRLYRNLYNPEFYYSAYQRIYARPGNMTKGTDDTTIDGMSQKRIESLIMRLKDHSYQPSPVRRSYIDKANGKKRPLGIPSFDDKLLQEVIRMMLENIYEPAFLNCSHGFRPKRSCHTALTQIQKSYTGVKWFVEGDIKGCFDNIDHHVLIRVLRKRIDDEYFIALIWKFLKAGYMENWVYHKTYSGTPQGSIISPILANIYLHELDCFVEKLQKQFNAGAKRRINPAYKKPLDVCRGVHERYKRNVHKMDEESKTAMLKQIRGMRQDLRKIPYGDPMDEGYKRLVYVRYADDFLLGVIGSKKDAEQIKATVGNFLQETLHLAMSEEKTLITHGNDFARFLGYDITASKDGNSTRMKNGHTKRSYTGRIKLYVPKEKWLNRLLGYGALQITHAYHDGNREIWKPIRRPSLLRLDDLEIIRQYNAEICGIYNYYRLAHNATILSKFYYVMRYSMYKTFAGKYKSSMRKMIKKYRIGKEFGVRYRTKSGEKVALLYHDGFRYSPMVAKNDPDPIAKPYFTLKTNSLMTRLRAEQCEICGDGTAELEMHHVRRLKDLKGKARWEKVMIAKKRKTLALCLDCHHKLHAGKLN